MNRPLFFRWVFFIFFLGIFLYSYVEKQNQATILKMKIPKLVKEITVVKQQNKKMQYEIDQWENPLHLMELSRSSKFQHLRHPVIQEIHSLPQGLAFLEKQKPLSSEPSHSFSIAMGVTPPPKKGFSLQK